jgi:DNA-binding IscR family transcriptional regulator
MILKSQVEWALHCCAILSGLPEGRYLSTKALAEFHGLPKEYLSKALQSLSQAGLVHTTLGPSGQQSLSSERLLRHRTLRGGAGDVASG